MMFVTPMERNPLLNFDFPVLANMPPNTFANMQTAHHQTEQEVWYGDLGIPPLPQGYACLRETPPGWEDWPLTAPFDPIIHIGKPATICHTARLSGALVYLLTAPGSQSQVILRAAPVGGGTAIPIPIQTVPNNIIPLTPGTPAPNVWYWLNPQTSANQELVCVIQALFTPTAALGYAEGETYKLIIDWNFTHTFLGSPNPLPVHGFDDSISFHIMPTM